MSCFLNKYQEKNWESHKDILVGIMKKYDDDFEKVLKSFAVLCPMQRNYIREKCERKQNNEENIDGCSFCSGAGSKL